MLKGRDKAIQYGSGCPGPALVGTCIDVRTWMACVGKDADEAVRPHNVQRCLDCRDRGLGLRNELPVPAWQEAQVEAHQLRRLLHVLLHGVSPLLPICFGAGQTKLLMPSLDNSQATTPCVPFPVNSQGMWYLPAGGSSSLIDTHPLGMEMYRHFKLTFKVEWQACTTSTS